MTSITCGKCKETHASVAQVKNCYSGTYTLANVTPANYPQQPVLPESYYALETHGVVSFFEAKKSKKGFTFVMRLVGASGDWRKYPLRAKEAQEIKTAIWQDTFVDQEDLLGSRVLNGPEGAALRFSRTFTRCACCSAPLSDPESVARGFGPVCAERFA